MVGETAPCAAPGAHVAVPRASTPSPSRFPAADWPASAVADGEWVAPRCADRSADPPPRRPRRRAPAAADGRPPWWLRKKRKRRTSLVAPTHQPDRPGSPSRTSSLATPSPPRNVGTTVGLGGDPPCRGRAPSSAVPLSPPAPLRPGGGAWRTAASLVVCGHARPPRTHASPIVRLHTITCSPVSFVASCFCVCACVPRSVPPHVSGGAHAEASTRGSSSC